MVVILPAAFSIQVVSGSPVRVPSAVYPVVVTPSGLVRVVVLPRRSEAVHVQPGSPVWWAPATRPSRSYTYRVTGMAPVAGVAEVVCFSAPYWGVLGDTPHTLSVTPNAVVRVSTGP